uniref:Uncharacterized protein n=1 Tax=Chromera velia CCMP2878 TaxID=1169474 RepID=A0A0G4I7T2_9ALVE|eukprot:Cvel_11776.t1-p1 / transcript=Cvel_11776.t1 / gene=Cvel_11776 / organism=Chromera_velia_CCMP2878 / gene_product=hypothetical protein / transcript_product=hypothetical protein / location=Cvel_scaffold749:14209-14493(+) / protein_length=95 / sequence_SO=supercontig / SO=protein_coding / is_pseudo=false
MSTRNTAALAAVRKELEAVAVSLLEVAGIVRNMGRILKTYNVPPVSDGEGDGSTSDSDLGPGLPPHPPAAAAAADGPPVVSPQESAALAYRPLQS